MQSAPTDKLLNKWLPPFGEEIERTGKIYALAMATGSLITIAVICALAGWLGKQAT